MSTNGKVFIVDTKTEEDQLEKRYTLIEENNNEIRILATNFEGMGNISDKFKDKASKLEVKETGSFHVHFRDSMTTINKIDDNRRYDYGSDEFEEDVDDAGGPRVTVATVHRNGDVTECRKKHSEKPQTTKKDEVEKKGANATIVAPTTEETKKLKTTNMPVVRELIVSRKSSSSASTVMKPKRMNMSFTDYRTREIHRENHVLMQKLLKSHGARASTPVDSTYTREANSAILRRRKQEKVNYENLILLRKLQSMKSSNFSFRR